MNQPDDYAQRVSAIAALDQPLRRDLYRLLAERGGWTSRDEAAEALDLPRSVAAFHLDKLVEAGVAEVRFERTSGRAGPGAGRPSKLYRRSPVEVAASVPPRHYDLAGAVLATAVADSARTGAPVADCVSVAARAEGHRIGEEARAHVGRLRVRGPQRWRRALLDVLARWGYEPTADRGGEILLANCPFHRLADAHRSLVCGMNLDLLTGVLEGMDGGDRLEARLAPEDGLCCVRFTEQRR
jgi:predicted ArsR family transcriptional regulator